MKKAILDTGSNFPGLSSKEAEELLEKFGNNAVFEKKKTNVVLVFLKKFSSPLLVILLIAAALSFFLGEKLNAIIIIFMVFLSVVLDFVNTYKSEKSLESLISRVVNKTTVIRDGKEKQIVVKDIVPGDILILTSGKIVPADCVVLEEKDLYVNEAALTGESFPQEKLVGVKVFMGTSVASGYATVKVERTGKGTEYGKIAERLGIAETVTSFEKDISHFSFFVMRVALLLVSLVFLVNAFVGRGWLTSFIFALAVAIGLTPELLPVIITVSLSKGSLAMAKKNVVVKNLSSIENFGSMDVLCTDKTGTLTEDRIVLVKYVNGLGEEDERVLLYSVISSTFHTGVANPLDKAVVNFRNHINIADYKKIDEIPFDFTRKRDSIVAENKKGRIIISKGAPEEIFNICSKYLDTKGVKKITTKAKKEFKNQFDELSKEGYRVLGISVKEVKDNLAVVSKRDEDEMTFVGFICFLDPPKEGVAEAIKQLNNLGVEFKVVTGDSELLTLKICKEINLAVKLILTGPEIEMLNDMQLKSVINDVTIFARVTPVQKERIVTLLKDIGKTVGYMGDGINDAPAIRAADVGISVNNAVDVAKETADIILLQKSLTALKDGVVEGRKIFQNTLKYMLMNLSSNFGNMFSLLGASAFLPFLPMLPAQVLLNNFLYDSSQMALSSDNVDEEDVKKPLTLSIPFLRKYMLVFGVVSSFFDFIAFGILFFVFKLSEGQFQSGWFLESIATQVLVVYIIRTKKVPFLESSPSKILLLSTVAVVIFALFVPVSPLADIFGFETINIKVILSIFGVVAAYVVCVEFVKRAFYKYLIKKNQFVV